jgi:hypothetical protein
MLNGADRLQGFSGQFMGGAKTVRVECPSFGLPGTYTFRASRTGAYKFVAWGGGGAGMNSQGGAAWGAGGSAAYGEITKTLAAGQLVTVQVGPSNGGTTQLAFPDGSIATATGGSGPTSAPAGGLGGTATGFDVNINGSQGATNGGTASAGGGTSGGVGGGTNGGAGAPANVPYVGAAGGAPAGFSGVAPGPGAGGCMVGTGATGPNPPGGCGLVLIQYLGVQ